jgi:hypothetical protein
VTSQLAQFGDMGLVNTLSGQAAPVASAFASPPAWIPGLVWYDTTNALLKEWNNSAWVSSPTPGARWLALLTSDPVASGVVNISDAGFTEMTTSGYVRVPVTFTNATTGYPSQASNAALLTFGPMVASMIVPIQWVAMVTSASGTSGQMLCSWALSAAVQVAASQAIYVSPNQLIIQGQ